MPDASPEISVVIATHARPERLALTIAGLRSQTLAPERFEVIVVADGGDEETMATLERLAADPAPPRLHVLRQAVRTGPAGARERGWRAAKAPVVAFTDDDCVPEPGWLEAGLAAIGAADTGFVQGRTEPEHDSEPAGPFVRTLSVTELDPNFQTCNMFFPRALLERLGGFDTDAFGLAPGGEDSDLAWRAIEAGAQPRFAADAIVRHQVADLGPIGKLRVANRWADTMRSYARHPELRRQVFVHGFFWKPSHALLALALAGLALPGRSLPVRALRLALALPYLRSIRGRAIADRASPLLIPYYALHDLVELLAVARGFLRASIR